MRVRPVGNRVHVRLAPKPVSGDEVGLLRSRAIGQTASGLFIAENTYPGYDSVGVVEAVGNGPMAVRRARHDAIRHCIRIVEEVYNTVNRTAAAWPVVFDELGRYLATQEDDLPHYVREGETVIFPWSAGQEVEVGVGPEKLRMLSLAEEDLMAVIDEDETCLTT